MIQWQTFPWRALSKVVNHKHYTILHPLLISILALELQRLFRRTLTKMGFKELLITEYFLVPSEPSDIVAGPSYSPSGHSMVKETQSHADHRSVNPFDLPYESDMEQSNMFMDMSSLETALPNANSPSSFLGVTQPWFPQDLAMAYIPAAPQGGLAYIAGQAPNPQLGNVQTQGPVASVGGNPFA
uniref:Uncharacterized protein n=1 Tax=Salix viminalis TaxID=40686 RepID=A0A6N2NGH2_SALVM